MTNCDLEVLLDIVTFRGSVAIGTVFPRLGISQLTYVAGGKFYVEKAMRGLLYKPEGVALQVTLKTSVNR